MAFLSKVGKLIRQTSTNVTASSSMLQSIRCMSSSKIFVGGISYRTNEFGLRETFSKYGKVFDARIIVDRETGRSRGFAFVTFTSSEEASKAMELDGQDLHGRKIRVSSATERLGGYGGKAGGPACSYGGGYSGAPAGGYRRGSYGGNAGGGGGYGGNSHYGDDADGVVAYGSDFDEDYADGGVAYGSDFDEDYADDVVAYGSNFDDDYVDGGVACGSNFDGDLFYDEEVATLPKAVPQMLALMTNVTATNQ